MRPGKKKGFNKGFVLFGQERLKRGGTADEKPEEEAGERVRLRGLSVEEQESHDVSNLSNMGREGRGGQYI